MNHQASTKCDKLDVHAGAANAASRYGGKPFHLHSGSPGRARFPLGGLGSQPAITLVRYTHALLLCPALLHETAHTLFGIGLVVVARCNEVALWCTEKNSPVDTVLLQG